VLKIRLQRTGKKNKASFRIVVANKENKVKGRFVEIIGHYLPNYDPKVFECQEDRIKYWISQGAKPSDTVARLLRKYKNFPDIEKFIKARVMKPTRVEREKIAADKKKAEELKEKKDAAVAEEKKEELVGAEK
jgi:small subunit ribosomal protein S16